MRTQLLVALLALTGAGRLTAQDHPALVVTASSVQYPEVLRAAGIAGLVEATVVVLPGDTVATDGVHVIASPHPGFRNAMMEGVRHWSYQAATLGGRAVADTLRIKLRFEPGRAGTLVFGPSEVRELGEESAGVWHATVSPTIVHPHGVELKGARRDSAGFAAVRYLAQQFRTTPNGGAPIVCVTLHPERGADPLTAAELAELQTPGVAMVHPRRCPPVFSSVPFVVDRVIPPGNDPSQLVVLGAREYTEGWIVIRVEARFSNGKNEFDCAVRTGPIGAVLECARRGSEVY